MAEKFSWSTNAGQWLGVPVRIHLFLFLVVAVIFGAEWNQGIPNTNFLVGTAMVTAIVFLASIILHELAHVFALTNLGGHTNSVLLMPWGGNSDLALPPSGISRIVIFLAGPFANGMVFIFGTVLLFQSESSMLTQLVNPFNPHWFNPAQWPVSLIKIVTWVNFQLAIFNLIPCYPFDGANVVRSIVRQMRIEVPQYRVESAIRLIGTAFAFSLIGLSWLCQDYGGGSIGPAWLLMLLAGITLLFSSRYSLHLETQQDPDWDELDEIEHDSLFDESSFYEFTDDGENDAYSQWLQEKQDERRAYEQLVEEEEDELADEILKKLHGDGMSSLSTDERSLLNRVSDRIRRRREQGV